MTTTRRTAKFTASVEAAKIAALLGGAPTQPVAAPAAKAAKATKAEKEPRQVLVLKRAVVKKVGADYSVNPGDVICLVRNGGGRVYTTILRRNKNHTCTCEGNAKWHKRCYHIDHCASEENARCQAAKKAAAIEAEQAMIAKAIQENRVIEASMVAAETKLIEAGKVVAEAAIATEARKIREASDRELAELAIEAEVVAAVAQEPTDMQSYRRRKAKEAEDAIAHRAKMLYECEAIKAGRASEEVCASEKASKESTERSMETAVLNGSSQGFNMYR